MNNGVDIICDICPNVKMSLTKTVGTKQSGKQYRMRWFKCPVCGMSDLIKPIEHKGEKFVPSYKLGVDRGFEFYKPSNFDLEINFEIPNYSTQIDLFTGFLIVQKLIEWHFDLFDGIKNNEAINVNDLETNPYK